MAELFEDLQITTKIEGDKTTCTLSARVNHPGIKAALDYYIPRARVIHTDYGDIFYITDPPVNSPLS